MEYGEYPAIAPIELYELRPIGMAGTDNIRNASCLPFLFFSHQISTRAFFLSLSFRMMSMYTLV